jgi:TniQ
MNVDDTKRLRLTPRPYPDESILGYIVRLTEENVYDLPSWIFDLAGIRLLAGQKWWTRLFEEDLDGTGFGRVISLEHAEFEAITYQFTEPYRSIFRNANHTVFISGSPVSATFTEYNSPKVCPACLRQVNYCRRLWDLLPYTACLKHKALLIDICPECGKRLSWERGKISVCRCGYDWRGSEVKVVDDSELIVSRLIQSVCILSSDTKSKLEGTKNPLHELKFDELQQALYLFAANYREIICGSSATARTENAVWHEAFSTAYSVFDEWPLNFRRFIKQAIQKATERHKFQELNYRISSSCKASALQFIIVAYEEVLEASSSEECIFADESLPDKRFINKEEAARQLNLRPVWIDALIEQGQLDVFAKGETDADHLVDRQSIYRYKSSVEQMLCTLSVAGRLNVEIDDMIELVRYGCLCAQSGPEIDGFEEWKFAYNAVEKLIGNISSRVISSCAPSVSELIGANDTFKYLKRHKLSVGRFISAVLAGEVNPVAESSGKGLSRFAFQREQVISYIQKLRSPRPARKLTLRDVAEFLDRKMAENELMHSNKGVEICSPSILVNVMRELCVAEMPCRPQLCDA